MSTVTYAAEREVNLLIGDLIDDKGQPMPVPPLLLKQLDYIAREAQLKFTLQRFPWRRALQNAESGEALIFGVSKTSARLRRFHFSSGLYTSYVFLVTRSDMQFTLSTAQDLKGKTLGVSAGTEFGDEFDRLKDGFFKIESDSGSPMSRFNKLLRKRTDATLISTRGSNPSVLQEKIRRLYEQSRGEDAQFESVQLSVLPKPLIAEEIHFAIRADKDDGIIQILNQVILKGRSSGELDSLPAKNNFILH
ncbi:substrate-binding periplasmic protein [Undibacterium sp. RuTC16W]|uniref:substrate-binding periplasmic protein n=1 Tax=Undibacterium sp. RuTC16W TaxID=3413048 RepID=UPI003BF15846